MSFLKKKLIKKIENPHDGEKWEIIPEEYYRLFPNGNSDKVPIELLDEILSDKELFEHCSVLFRNNCNLKFIAHRNNIGDTVYYYTFSKSSVINALKENKYRYKKNPNKYTRLNQLIETSEYSFYENEVAESIISIGEKKIKIKDIIKLLGYPITENNFISSLNELNISISELVEILQKPPLNLIQDFRNEEVSIMDGYNFPEDEKKQISQNVNYINNNSYLFNKITGSNYYVLDIINFFKEKNIEEYVKKYDKILGYSFAEIALILNNYIFQNDYEHLFEYAKPGKFIRMPDELRNKLENFIELYIPDPLAEKEFLGDNNYSDVEIDEDLKNKILEEIPANYTDLQKVYFIYKYICANFVYDPYYLAGSQKEKHDINNHKNINNVKNINLNKNQVVCYDISVVLAKLIEALGLPVQVIDSKGKSLIKYGSSHAAVVTKIGYYWIKLDIAEGLIHNDMTYQQLKGEIRNFIILNSVNRTYQNAKREIEEVERELNLKYDSFKKYTDALEEYKAKYANNNAVSFDEKIDIVISSLLEQSIDDTSKILYVKDVIDQIFGEESDKCFVAFVGSKINTRSANEVALGCILVCNKDCETFNSNNSGNRYYFFPNLREFQELTKDQIEELIREKKIIGIDQLEINLRGIDVQLTEDQGR